LSIDLADRWISLEMDGTNLIIDNVEEEIATRAGVVKAVCLRLLTMGLPTKDTEEIMNHVRATEYVRLNLRGKPKSVAVRAVYTGLKIPDTAKQFIFRSGFESVPIHAKGIVSLRPYPLELEAAFRKLVDLHSIHHQQVHPIVSSKIHFLFVHLYRKTVSTFAVLVV
jgi:hypothetical protein